MQYFYYEIVSVSLWNLFVHYIRIINIEIIIRIINISQNISSIARYYMCQQSK